MRIPAMTLVAVLTLIAAAFSTAMGQVDRITVTVPAEHIGLGGVVRPGTWTPMRVTLNNPSPDPRQVAVQWAISDSDGDTVLAQRVMTLAEQRDGQTVWLYACPTLGPIDSVPVWQVGVFDWSNGRLGRRLGDPVLVSPARMIVPSKRAIGMTSSQYLGLDPFEDEVTQHEACEYLRGLEPARQLPDRWHGMAMMESLIWTGDGGDPGDPGVPTEAIRDWVHRGGHLVIVLSNSLGWNVWSTSPLAVILPDISVDRIEDAQAPRWFGPPRPERISYFRLQPAPGGKTTVVFEDDQMRPVVVARPHGFGRVTVVGFDLTDPQVRAAWDEYRVIPGVGLWNTIFRWQTPAFRKNYVQSAIENGLFQRPMFTTYEELGRFIPAQVSRSQTIATALLLAMIVFLVYWLAAGPMGFAVLRSRGLVRHSWVAFVAVVLVFSVLTWGGALALRPTRAAISHLTVLDIDAATRTVRARSWMALFVPEHGDVEVTLAPDAIDGAGNVWASPGFDPRRPDSGYVDRQSYAIDVASPSRRLPGDVARARGVLVPMRATTKSMMADYVGPLPHDSPWLGINWVMPVGDISIEAGAAFPTGRLRHGMPGDLRNVLLIYCPGGDQQPWVVDYGAWPADAALDVRFTGEGVSPRRLVQAPTRANDPWGGFLGGIKLGGRGEFATPTTADEASQPLDASLLTQHLWMLSFFGTLPPPQYETRADRTLGVFRTANLGRSVGREIDITALTGLKRLIVIGMLERSPLPMPLAVDGQRLNADGWTLVRWHYDLD
jgi:hypothetical protein